MTTAMRPPATARAATPSDTRWLRPSCCQRARRDWANFFMVDAGQEKGRTSKIRKRGTISHLHAHEFLVGLDELVADLDHHGERDGSLLHGDDALVELVAVAEEHFLREFGRLGLLG